MQIFGCRNLRIARNSAMSACTRAARPAQYPGSHIMQINSIAFFQSVSRSQVARDLDLPERLANCRAAARQLECRWASGAQVNAEWLREEQELCGRFGHCACWQWVLAVGDEAFGSNASLGGSTRLQDCTGSRSITKQIGFHVGFLGRCQMQELNAVCTLAPEAALHPS